MSEDNPLTLDYYLSIPVNAYSEGNTYTQEDATEQAEIEFKQDSIVKTIGTRECIFNIDNFWTEVFNSFLDKDQERNFLKRIMNKLIGTYGLDILEQYTTDYYGMDNFKTEIFRILKFFETSKCVEIFANMFYSNSVEYVTDDQEQLKQYLDLIYETAIQKMIKFKDDMSPWLYYVFSMMAKNEFIDLSMKLIDRYKNEFLTEILIIREDSNAQN